MVESPLLLGVRWLRIEVSLSVAMLDIVINSTTEIFSDSGKTYCCI